MTTPMSTLTMPNGKTYEIVDKQARKTIERDCATVVAQTVEGAGIAVADSSNRPIRSLRIFGKTKQTTTPSPDRPQDLESVETPIVTIRGGNLIPADYADGTSKTMNGITFEALPDGSVLVNGTATATAYFSFNTTGHKILMPNGWLSTSSGIGHGSGIPHVQNDIYVDGIYVTSVQTVLESSSKKQFFGKVELGASRIKVDSGVTVINQRIYPMLCAFENVLDYEPPKQSQTMTIDRSLPGLPVDDGGNYTDADGQQWICDEIDFERGVHIQRIGVTDFTDAVWSVNSNNQFFTTLDSDKYVAGSSVMCSHLVGGTDIYINAVNAIRVNATIGDGSAEALGNALSGATLLGILSTPIITPLTEDELAAYSQLCSNYPVTTVINDKYAWMEMTYSADLKKFIMNNNSAPSDEQVSQAVASYLEKNPPNVGGSPARIGNVSLLASKWVGSNHLYSQVVTIEGVTENSQVDLTPSVEQLVVFYEKDLTFVTEQEGGVVTVYAIGQKPEHDYTIQVTITEVNV